ncbi:MAG: hypothetical protein NVV74_13415 [Magnetospirillum sp.]|nr:hypothetical protein [Magnetospirillum sp.]
MPNSSVAERLMVKGTEVMRVSIKAKLDIPVRPAAAGFTGGSAICTGTKRTVPSTCPPVTRTVTTPISNDAD